MLAYRESDMIFSAGFARHKAAVTTITPDLAAQWLGEYNFDGQRKVNRAHVIFLADVMRKREFDGGEPVRFVITPPGQRILVNGQHRLLAIAESGLQQEMVVIETMAASVHEAATIYARVDRGMGRSIAEVLKALGAHEGTRLTYTQAGRVSAAGPLLDTILKTGAQRVGASYEMKSTDARSRYIAQYADRAEMFFDAIEGSDHSSGRILQKAAVLAVALATFERPEYRELAAKFWGGIARDDGLRAKDPRKAAIRFLAEGKGRRASNQVDTAHAMALCWNAFFEGRDLSIIRVESDRRRPVVINGTSFARAGGA